MAGAWVALLLVGAALAGCMGTPEASATGTLYVKDALTEDVAEVHVTFVAAEALPEGAQEWITVYAGERTIDLLSLSDTLAREKLADLDLEPGAYAGLRIAVSSIEVVHKNGTETALAALGNVVTIGKAFSVQQDGSTDLVVDFDLDKGVDLQQGTYTPHVRDVQTSREDADNDGIPDLDDRDDDNDGIEDAKDEDRDGNGNPDAPPQEQAMDARGVYGLCTAWTASETGRAHDEAGNSTAYQWLHAQAAAENQTVEEYCAAQQPPVPDQARGVLEIVGQPVAIHGKPEDIPRGQPAEVPQGKPEQTPGDDARPEAAPDQRGAPEGENDTAAPENAERGDPAYNHTGHANQTYTAGPDAPAANETHNNPAAEANSTSQPEKTPQQPDSGSQQPSETGSGDSTSSRPSDG